MPDLVSLSRSRGNSEAKQLRAAAFRATDVTVYRIHWDNGDDPNAEGIIAIKASTGEIQVLALVNPA